MPPAKACDPVRADNSASLPGCSRRHRTQQLHRDVCGFGSWMLEKSALMTLAKVMQDNYSSHAISAGWLCVLT
eukprot:12942293-Heterocapsa_arctica.AAC.1